VVTTLFSWIRPDVAVFGQKDFMQCILIQNLCRQFFPDLEIVVHGTVREEDGLAMSSRNTKLSETERERAPLIYNTLSVIASMLFDHINGSDKDDEAVPVRSATKIGLEFAKQNGVDLEYISFHRFSDGHKLEEHLDLIPLLQSQQIVISIAGSVGPSTRLIDNVVIGGKDQNKTLVEGVRRQTIPAHE